MPDERVVLLTPEQAAEALGIGRWKLYDLLRQGRLRSLRIGSCRRSSGSWEPGRFELKRLSSRRDITGLRFTEYQLVVEGEPRGRFGAVRPVGRLPVAIGGTPPATR